MVKQTNVFMIRIINYTKMIKIPDPGMCHQYIQFQFHGLSVGISLVPFFLCLISTGVYHYFINLA